MENENIRYDCAVDAAMSVIEGRWKVTILCLLTHNGPMRFSELQKVIGKISSRILTKQLKELEADHMITRNVDSEKGVKVCYELTSKGMSIIPILKDLAMWGLNNQFITPIVPSDPVSTES
ncbi:MAG: helix-turn-helix transcriptional regulator [Candidatus Methanomethylophilaceae archaeon]|nr:helix-turn-helix transcriptional regulator [Candidatus Methanomethylophilaceae archaeon]